jgi:hypothetical protein
MQAGAWKYDILTGRIQMQYDRYYGGNGACSTQTV